MNLDDTDRKILHELQVDARRPNTELAAAANVSPSTIVNRLRSLEQSNVIRGYHADVDPPALGRTVEALVSVRLRPKDPASVEAFLDAVWSLDETVAVWLVTGENDVLVHLSVSDMATLSQTVLSAITGAPNVVDERTSIVFEHRSKRVLTAVDHP
jgi:DNA-binding Lrp family transcriptional regulator